MRKTRQGSSFGRVCASPPPPTSIMGGNPDMFWAYRSLQSQMSGGLRKFHQPAIWAARGRRGGGKILPKLESGQLFCQLRGENWITAGDCGAIVGMPRYRSGSPTDTANHFAWLAPLGSASKKQLKTRILEPFHTEWTREGCLGNNPHTAEAWPPNGFPMGGEGGGGGRNRPKLEFWCLFWQKAFI